MERLKNDLGIALKRNGTQRGAKYEVLEGGDDELHEFLLHWKRREIISWETVPTSESRASEERDSRVEPMEARSPENGDVSTAGLKRIK